MRADVVALYPLPVPNWFSSCSVLACVTITDFSSALCPLALSPIARPCNTYHATHSSAFLAAAARVLPRRISPAFRLVFYSSHALQQRVCSWTARGGCSPPLAPCVGSGRRQRAAGSGGGGGIGGGGPGPLQPLPLPPLDLCCACKWEIRSCDASDLYDVARLRAPVVSFAQPEPESTCSCSSRSFALSRSPPPLVPPLHAPWRQQLSLSRACSPRASGTVSVEHQGTRGRREGQEGNPGRVP